MLLAHQSKNPNLYLPGLTPEGRPRFLLNVPGAWDNMRADQGRGGPGDAYLDELCRTLLHNSPGGMAGLAILDTIDNATGLVLARDISHNVETDNFFNNQALKIFGSAAYTPTQGQYLAISTATASVAQNGATVATTTYNATTGYPVVAGGAASLITGIASSTFKAAATVDGLLQNTGNAAAGVPSITGGKYPGSDNTFGTGIIIGYGTPNAEVANGSTTTSTATAIFLSGSSTSQTNYALVNAHANGDFVVAGPSCKDGPTAAPTGAQISTAIAGSATAGSGVGNRKMQLQFTFTTSGGFTAASYTDLWVITVSTTGAWTAATVPFAHTVNAPQVLNSSQSIQATYLAIF